MRTKLWYNASNQITKQSWTIGDSTYEETYTYNTGDGTLSAYHNPLGQTISLSYDSLRRLSTITAGNIYTKSYTYRDIDSTKTTTQVSSLSYSGFTDAPSFGYTYDELGNIATYTENGTVYTYTYDDLNQLLTATGGGKTWAYTYDLGGNILTATDGTTSHTYTYGDANWADLLTAYDGQTITYDGSGNPLSYYNGSRYTFTWEEGRRLATASGNGHNVSYTYDLNGLRLSRTVDGTKTYSYAYIGDQLSEMTIDENGTVRRLSFVYDSTGPYAVTVTNGSSSTTYYYVLNLQGDVVAIVNGAGTAVVEYTYDPWGKLLSIDGAYKNGLGIRNPLRYRGYVYDTETELYYLQSRYYDPKLSRWINAEPNIYDGNFDEGAGLIGYNVYTYCANNPVCFFDPIGEFVISTLLICVVGGAIVGGTIGGVAGNAYANSKGYTGWNKIKSIFTGIGLGCLSGGTLGYFAAPAIVSATGVAGVSVTFGGISTIAAIGTSFGKLGTLIPNNGQQIIDWINTTIHGFQRMTERGVTKNMVELWVKTGKALQQSGDKILYITKQGVVVIDKAGRVITAYTSEYYDATIKQLVEILFGK